MRNYFGGMNVSVQNRNQLKFHIRIIVEDKDENFFYKQPIYFMY
jgi:hypothetical protein